MLFAPPNTTVIEFPLRPHVNRCFGYMAMALGLDYWVVPQLSSVYTSIFRADSDNIGAVARTLRHVLKLKGMGHLLTDSHDTSSTVADPLEQRFYDLVCSIAPPLLRLMLQCGVAAAESEHELFRGRCALLSMYDAADCAQTAVKV